MELKTIGEAVKNGAKDKLGKVVLDPLNKMADETLTDIVTTIGGFVIREIKGKYQRSISFTIGINYSDRWMEEALYGILYKYNNIKGCRQLTLTNERGSRDGSGMYYQLEDGNHNLKYRNYNILLNISSVTPTSITGRTSVQRVYTIITYNLSPQFVTDFERDMIAHRNSLLKIRADAPNVNVYQDLHESDGYTYWEKTDSLPKRKINTIYLPTEKKKLLVDTINRFFADKSKYRKHGVPHNLKILLYGPPGPQPLSIMIPTPDGMRMFGDLKVGDLVFNREGKPTTVTEIYPKGVQDVFEVKFLNGRKTKCTADHLWKVYRRSHNEWKEDVVPLQYIIDSSALMDAIDGSTLLINEQRFSVPNNGAAQFNERKLHIDPYVMGILITNGCLTDEYLRISQPTNEVPEAVGKILGLNEVSRSEDIDDYSYIFYDNDSTRVRTADVLRNYPSLIGCKSPDRFIPEDFLYNSIENRLALLNGLLDGDGSIVERSGRKWTSPVIRFTTTSQVLAQQVMWLCRSLGFNCLEHLDTRKKYTSGYCADISIHVHPDKMMQLFRVSYKQEIAARSLSLFYECKDTLKWTKYHDRSKIVSIKKLPPEEVMCIKVSDPEHLYLTEDFVVTHNTGKDSIARMIASEWNRNMYYVRGGKEGRFIPDAITDSSDAVNYPLFLISDIDKYPYLINEPDVALDGESAKDDKMKYKQLFGNMINALDGVLSGEDRIIIMTTNHIEKFSDTIIRPGRVDLKMEIGYVTPEVFRKYVWEFYHVELPEDIKLKDAELTVARMQGDVMFMHLSADEFIAKYVDFGKKKK